MINWPQFAARLVNNNRFNEGWWQVTNFAPAVDEVVVGIPIRVLIGITSFLAISLYREEYRAGFFQYTQRRNLELPILAGDDLTAYERLHLPEIAARSQRRPAGEFVGRVEFEGADLKVAVHRLNRQLAQREEK